MIEDLLKAKKISPEQFKVYNLFVLNELGREVLDNMIIDSFMDEPREKEFGGQGFAFYDGRRSVFRDIRRTILYVKEQIKELNHDDSKRG